MTQQDVFRHQLMLRDIHQQVLLVEDLNHPRQHARNQLLRAPGHRPVRDEDPRVIVPLVDRVRELPEVPRAHALVVVELHPHGADVRRRRRLRRGRRRRVLVEHGLRRARGETHLAPVGAALGARVLRGEGVERDVDFVLQDLVAPVGAHLVGGLPGAPRAGEVFLEVFGGGHGGGVWWCSCEAL